MKAAAHDTPLFFSRVPIGSERLLSAAAYRTFTAILSFWRAGSDLVVLTDRQVAAHMGEHVDSPRRHFRAIEEAGLLRREWAEQGGRLVRGFRVLFEVRGRDETAPRNPSTTAYERAKRPQSSAPKGPNRARQLARSSGDFPLLERASESDRVDRSDPPVAPHGGADGCAARPEGSPGAAPLDRAELERLAAALERKRLRRPAEEAILAAYRAELLKLGAAGASPAPAEAPGRPQEPRSTPETASGPSEGPGIVPTASQAAPAAFPIAFRDVPGAVRALAGCPDRAAPGRIAGRLGAVLDDDGPRTARLWGAALELVRVGAWTPELFVGAFRDATGPGVPRRKRPRRLSKCLADELRRHRLRIRARDSPGRIRASPAP